MKPFKYKKIIIITYLGRIDNDKFFYISQAERYISEAEFDSSNSENN